MNTFLLDGTTQGTSGGMGIGEGVIYIVVIIALFYFFMIRPQKKQEKETAAMRNSLGIGDEITTIGGIIGRITHIKDDVVTIESGADRNKIRIRKSAIATVDKKYGEEKAPKGGYKVKGVKKGEKKGEKSENSATPIEAPALKEEAKAEKTDKNEDK